ncbi:ribosomal-processing cysteine protease Prp [Neobacillus sp. D3-1R]|uniref:ribosomal-processing cysteine protease Prp n=1 Tax=Neobacillus sp. D3-1R TaxID=3445778 RepID=UPI003F9FA2A3
MIQVTINRLESGLIQAFSLSGHAQFANRGQDIVCAGASAVSFGAVNSVIALTGVEPKIEQGKDGFLRCVIPDHLSEETQKKVQLLLEGMIVSLQTIEKDYGKHIKINFL